MKYIIFLLLSIPFSAKTQLSLEFSAKTPLNFESIYSIFRNSESLKNLDTIQIFESTAKANLDNCEEILYFNKDNKLEKYFFQKNAIFFETTNLNYVKDWTPKLSLIPNIREVSRNNQNLREFNDSDFYTQIVYSVDDKYFIQTGTLFSKDMKPIYALYIYDKQSCYYKNSVSYRGFPRSKILY